MYNFPYVYKLTHKKTGKFYFGSRWANMVYSQLDLAKNMSLAKKGKIPKHSLITMKTWQLINPEGTNFETKNLSEFCRKHNLNQGSMSAIAQGKQKTYKGWKCYII